MEIGKVEMFQGFGWGVCRKRQETEGKIRQRLDKWKVLCASHDTTSSKFKKLFFSFLTCSMENGSEGTGLQEETR